MKLAATVPLMAGGALLLKACGSGGNDSADAPVGTLPIPPLVRADASNAVHLQIQKGQHEFLPGKRTATFGVNGALLGPTLVVKRGRQFNVTVGNGLDEDTVLHWHGLSVNGADDGGPASMIGPTQRYGVKADVDQPAATLWYHAHPHGRSGFQSAMGIGGMLIVEDDASAALGLPATWGHDDIPVMIQDKYLNADGQIVYKFNQNIAGLGWLGRHVFVNGVQNATHHAPRGWVRLRVLNACNARVIRLRLASNAVFHVIASDGGLLAAPVPLASLDIVAGERFEILVDGSAGQPVELIMAPYDLQYGSNAAPFDVDTKLLTIYPTQPARNALMPASLALLPDAVVPEGVRQRDITFQLMGHFPNDPNPGGPLVPMPPFDFSWNDADSVMDHHALMHFNQITVDGQEMESFSMNRAAFTVPRGQVEKWTLTLRHGDISPHPFHVHGAQFRVIKVNGGEVPAHWRGWKDTVNIQGAVNARSRPGTVEILVRFDHLAALPHAYMVHCHILEHEDAGMMLGFVVA